MKMKNKLFDTVDIESFLKSFGPEKAKFSENIFICLFFYLSIYLSVCVCVCDG